MPRAFSYEQGDGSPTKYNNTISTAKPVVTGTWIDYSNPTSKAEDKRCNIETTDGQMLVGGSQMRDQLSCVTHAYNAGNVYNFPAASAGMSDPATRSVCPKGWYLPDKIKETDYSHVLIAYGIDYNASSRTNQDAELVNLPLSFLRSGYYNGNGTLSYQGNYGVYRMTSQRLYFNSNTLNPTYDTGANGGYSVRCVGR